MGGYVILEVDEHQHNFGYDSKLSCDMKRMSKVMTSLVMEVGDAVPNMFWIRYNPHAWRVNGERCSVPKTEREAWLCSFISGLEVIAPLTIGYAYYDSSGGVLDVLSNEYYHPAFAEVAIDLSPMSGASRSRHERELVQA